MQAAAPVLFNRLDTLPLEILIISMLRMGYGRIERLPIPEEETPWE
jgi:hypothetical protein